MNYQHLSDEERNVIGGLLSLGYPQAQIARELQRSPSTISRELTRNAYPTDGRYRAYHAGPMARGRRQRARRGKSIFSMRQWARVEGLLNKKWSPCEVCGHLRITGEFRISHQSIYRYIKLDRENGGTLFEQLRHSRKQRRKKRGSNDSRGRLRGKPSIETRPAIVEQRSRIGDWEIDTVFGSGKESILTMVERKSGYTIIGFLDSRTVENTNCRMRKLIARFPEKFLTITSDNGTEFNGYKEIETQEGIPFYFTHPYHSWERGTNENTNGLIRQYLPKGSSFADLTQARCNAIANELNHRPRKRLNFLTPSQVFNHSNFVALHS